jgi:tRNA threonylcarbamoyladenosine biosynthesis protein TsaB
MTAPILVIDTVGPWCAAAMRRGEDVFESAEEIGRGHAERLAPMVEEVLAQAGVAAGALSRIGVNTGPGSFAGARVGVAFARGLALSTGAQAVGVGLLAALARRAAPKRAHTVMAVHDVKREELAWTVFTHGVAVTPLERGSVDHARSTLAAYGDVILTGSGAAALGADPSHFDPRPPLAELLALTAEAPADAPPPAPVYARPPDAKPSA